MGAGEVEVGGWRLEVEEVMMEEVLDEVDVRRDMLLFVWGRGVDVCPDFLVFKFLRMLELSMHTHQPSAVCWVWSLFSLTLSGCISSVQSRQWSHLSRLCPANVVLFATVWSKNTGVELGPIVRVWGWWGQLEKHFCCVWTERETEGERLGFCCRGCAKNRVCIS